MIQSGIILLPESRIKYNWRMKNVWHKKKKKEKKEEEKRDERGTWVLHLSKKKYLKPCKFSIHKLVPVLGLGISWPRPGIIYVSFFLIIEGSLSAVKSSVGQYPLKIGCNKFFLGAKALSTSICANVLLGFREVNSTTNLLTGLIIRVVPLFFHVPI